MLGALAKAASDHAAGLPPDKDLVGRTFIVRLPFGCAGPNVEDGASRREGLAHWTWSKDRKSIRLAATPADWTRSPLVLADGADPQWESVEGFWIERPWLLSEACPAPGASTPPAPDVSTPPLRPAFSMTTGLAAVHSPEGSRLGRREGEDYSFVIRGSGDQPPPLPLDGYRLVLEGRLAAFPGGAAVRCRSQSPELRPVCVAAIQLDVVAFEDGKGSRLSEWRPT